MEDPARNGMARPRESERKDIRALVLAAAKKLFMKLDYREVTMRRIAKEIGYSPGAIYLYFKNKDEILYEIHNEGFRILHESRAKALADGPKTALEKLAAGGKNYIAFALENPELYELMFIMREPRDYIESHQKQTGRERGVNYIMKSYENLKESIMACKAEGYYRDVDPDLAAFFHWSLVHGLACLAIRGRDVPFPKAPTRDMAEMAIEFLTQLIESTGRGTSHE